MYYSNDYDNDHVITGRSIQYGFTCIWISSHQYLLNKMKLGNTKKNQIRTLQQIMCRLIRYNRLLEDYLYSEQICIYLAQISAFSLNMADKGHAIITLFYSSIRISIFIPSVLPRPREGLMTELFFLQLVCCANL